MTQQVETMTLPPSTNQEADRAAAAINQNDLNVDEEQVEKTEELVADDISLN